MLWRTLPLAGIAAVIVIAGCIRPFLQLLRHGTSGIHLFNPGFVQKLRDGLFLAMLGGFLAQAIVGPLQRPWVRLLLAESSLLYQVLQVIGGALIIGGVVLFATAQLNLGASWRVGIDEITKPGVVTAGLYRFSRHPIYLGFLTVFAGYTAMLPTRLSLVLLAAAYLGLRSQAGREEAYLLRTYGEPYRAYARRVGRFVPWVGRL